MAMLAGPRQRKRYNLVPRGKALYEDDNRFGTKMLEKMGWAKGKGLGANEDGSQEFVRVRYKNDVNGFGYENRDDQWTQHEESFNGLLNSLHGDEKCANEVENDAEDPNTTVGFGFQSEPKKNKLKLKEKFSGESLEEKSKKSKARVHYKKFTRGKDLSRYSEKDLANIFGKKDVAEQAANAVYEQFTAFKMDNDDMMVVEEEKEVKSNFAGVPTINTGLSVSDYFKQKMEAMKNRINSKSEHETKVLIDVAENESSECSQESKKKKKKQKRAYNEIVEEATEPEVITQKKKKRKQNGEDESFLSNVQKNVDEVELEIESLNSKKEKRKAKKLKQNSLVATNNTTEAIEEIFQNNNCNNSVEEIPIVKVEKKKSKKTPPENMMLDETVVNETATKISKKSKKKSKATKESYFSESLSAIEQTQQKQEIKVELATDKKEKFNFDLNENDDSELIELKTNQISSKKKEDVSVENEIPFKEELSLEDLKVEQNSYNIYKISTFCAEKFRNTDLTCFVGSNLSVIVGYSLNDQLKLDIMAIDDDRERIFKVWNSKTNKYENCKYADEKKYKKYMKQAHRMRKSNRKIPRLNFKSYLQKDAFTGI